MCKWTNSSSSQLRLLMLKSHIKKINVATTTGITTCTEILLLKELLHNICQNKVARIIVFQIYQNNCCQNQCCCLLFFLLFSLFFLLRKTPLLVFRIFNTRCCWKNKNLNNPFGAGTGAERTKNELRGIPGAARTHQYALQKSISMCLGCESNIHDNRFCSHMHPANKLKPRCDRTNAQLCRGSPGDSASRLRLCPYWWRRYCSAQWRRKKRRHAGCFEN